MTWEPRPTPEVTPETRRYWRAASEGRLLLRECRRCGLTYHYPRPFCPDCFSEDVEWREADGTGVVYTYTVSRQLSGWPESDLPLVVAYVELDEGPRLVTDLVDCAPDDVDVGDRVEVRFRETESADVSIPVFVPVQSSGES